MYLIKVDLAASFSGLMNVLVSVCQSATSAFWEGEVSFFFIGF